MHAACFSQIQGSLVMRIHMIELPPSAPQSRWFSDALPLLQEEEAQITRLTLRGGDLLTMEAAVCESMTNCWHESVIADCRLVAKSHRRR